MISPDMQGKICLVTGSTRGLGKAVARAMAGQHATVILGCRDRSRGEAVLAEIRGTYPEANVDLLVLDLSVQRSIRDAVKEFEDHYDHLDVLVNNAAVFTRERRLTTDGYEMMFATNHLGPFLLTTLLLPRLKTAPHARILNVTAPTPSRIAFDDLQSERKFNSIQAFSMSKAANLLFTSDLAHRLAESNVTVNAFYPGIVKTALMREGPLPFRWFNPVFGKAPEPVAQSVVYYLSAPEVQTMTGLLFTKDRKSLNSSPYTRDPAIQQQLWDASVALAPVVESDKGSGDK